MSKSKNEPYQKLTLWEQIIDWQLLFLVIFAIMSLISMKMEDSGYMWQDVLVNVGCSVLASVSVSIFIYYKFLKKIPEENKKKIEELLNSRLSHETTNHNSVLSALNPNTAHLSKEHSEIFSSVSKIKDSMIRNDERQKLNHESLGSDQKIVVDSINRLSVFSELLQEVNLKNMELAVENNKLKFEIAKLQDEQNKSKSRQSDRGRENEYER